MFKPTSYFRLRSLDVVGRERATNHRVLFQVTANGNHLDAMPH